MNQALKYRPEIDGLRALAVVPVILFHAGFNTFSGGFIGVDVFFVISGYLITSIIMRDLDAGTFSFLTFYERRARRILPALYFMIVCCLPFAWFWLFPKELIDFSQTLNTVIIFGSNFYFWKDSAGYFAPASELRPLLHTWSLAVEEQFYVLFPIIIIAAQRHAPKRLIFIVLGIGLSSLALSDLLSYNHRAFDFFMLPTRAWELMAGALCSFWRPSSNAMQNNALSTAGVIALLTAVFCFDDHTRLPSLIGLLPVLGACAFIVFARQGTWVHKVFSTRPVVGVGLVSYSAYLWHQPLFAFARLRLFGHLSALVICALIGLTFLLAYLSWRFIETPLRHNRPGAWVGNKLFVSSAVGFAALFLCLGISGDLSHGAPQRLPKAALAMLSVANDFGAYRNKCLEGPALSDPFVATSCHLGVSNRRTDFILFGDSYAGALADGVNVAAIAAKKSGLFFGLHACPPIIGIGGTWLATQPRCKPFQKSILTLADELKPSAIILHANWEQLNDRQLITDYANGADDGIAAFKPPLVQMLKELWTRNIKTFIVCCVSHANEHVDVPVAMAKNYYFGASFKLDSNPQALKRSNSVAYALFNSDEVRQYSTVIDLTDHFCHEDICGVVRDGKSLFFAPGHITKAESLALSSTLQTIFTLSEPRVER